MVPGTVGDIGKSAIGGEKEAVVDHDSFRPPFGDFFQEDVFVRRGRIFFVVRSRIAPDATNPFSRRPVRNARLLQVFQIDIKRI